MDISHLRIKLPCEIERKERTEEKEEKDEKEEKEKKEESTEERVLAYLRQFHDKIIQCVQYIELYIPYPSISQIHKTKIRDKVNHLKSFYYECNKINPCIISDFESKDDPISKEICTVFQTVSDLLDQMNKHIDVILTKKVIAFDSSSLLYDWA